MKLKFIIIASLILAILAIGAVSATDALSEEIISDADNDVLEIVDTNLYAASDPGTFTDLQNNISAPGTVLEIMDNYKFDNESDEYGGIAIDKDNFVINGNGHIIDGNNQSGIFYIYGNNVTINNLTFINANSAVGSVFNIRPGASLTTNNVIIENNTANTGVILAMGEYISNNDKVTDSTSSTYGVIIIFENTTASFNNALMKSSKQLEWGFIYGLDGSCINVFNSTFANTTSKYSTAIYGNKITRIKNSKFINLYASVTAGAIGVKSMEECEIDNCTFSYIISGKNAGAIMADVGTQNISQVIVNNSEFVECYSEFGGAIMQLGSRLIVENSNFFDNSALFDGGAIYTSYVRLDINNCIFDGNYAESGSGDRGSYGGTFFSDRAGFNLFDCEIANSHAQFGGAIYLYDSNYVIVGNTFYNNDGLNGSDIFTAFDGEGVLAYNEFSDVDTLSLNNTIYETIINATGMKLILINNTINVTTLPARFDLRDYGWVSPVRNQGTMGSCWAFGTAGAVESAILRYLGFEMDISENNMQDVSLQYYKYGTDGMTEGGSVLAGASYVLSWFGVFPAEYDTYDELGKISPIFATDDSIHFQDVVFISPRKNVTDNDRLKEALLKYGALSVSYYAAQTPPYYNAETAAQYCDVVTRNNHGVTLIGWDDDFSASNFLITPPGDGAWIFKNSWGENSGENGYFYISYYDPSFVNSMPAVAFALENTVEYNKNYQYDIGGQLDNLSLTEYRNLFMAVEDDLIAGVGTYFGSEGVEYCIEIFVNDVLKLTQTGISPFYGFHTIQLDSFVPVKEGDIFTVKIKSDMVPIFNSSRQFYIEGTSQYLKDGVWINASDFDQVCSIKVYTVADNRHDTKLVSPDRIIGVSDGINGYDYQFILKDVNGTALANKEVQISFNGKNQTVTTDEKGWGTVTLKANTEGSYKVKISFKGDNDYREIAQTATIKLVKQKTSFVAPDRKVYVQKIFSGYSYSVILKDNNGKALANKKILFTFNGKKTIAFTDEKGWATVKLTAQNAGTQTVTVKFAGDRCYREITASGTITILRESTKITTPDKIFKKADNNKQVTATLKSKSDQPIKGVKVTLKVNGKTYTATTNNNGIAIFKISLTQIGIFKAVTQFAESRFFSASKVTSQIVIV